MPNNDPQPAVPQGAPSHTQQSWGVVISIVIIVLMIVIGAFYAWNNRASQNAASAVPEVAL